MNLTYAAVKEQTGVYAGQRGYDVKVGGLTALDGAVIGSTATADRNRLDTGTLSFAAIENRAKYNVEHQSVTVGGSNEGNLLSTVLAGLNGHGSASSTTRSAVSDGSLTVRDGDKQQQDVSKLSRDVAHAHQALSPIFNKEQEQQRLQAAKKIGDIATQVSGIIEMQGKIAAAKVGTAKADTASAEARSAARSQWEQDHKGKTATQADIHDQLFATAYNAALVAAELGTGGEFKRAAQSAIAVVQGLATGNIAQAIAGGSAPYIANIIKKTTPAGPERVMAHAVVGAVVAQLSGGNALAGASGAAMREYIASQVYAGTQAKDLTESQKTMVSALGTLAAGLAGGLAGGDVASAVAGAQAGKNAVENNFLSNTSSEKLDKAIEKIKNGDKSLATANELIKLENADKRSDALVSKFTKDPSQMNGAEQAELAGYLRVYASEMAREHGPAVAQELVKGLLSGQDYIQRNPDSEAMSKAQTIMNTWGYHKSNASIGDAPLIFGSSVLGITVKGMAVNTAIGVGVNTGVQLAGKDPFSYVDMIMAGVTAAATTGKGIIASAPINMGGAAIGSGIKGEEPVNSMAGAGAGTVAGGIGGTIIKGVTSKVAEKAVSDLTGAIGGSYLTEKTGNFIKDNLDEKGENDNKK